MSFRCACGREIDGPSCAACGAAYELRPGWRAVRCECGAQVFAAPGQVGTTIPCSACFLRVNVGPDAPPAPPTLKSLPRRRSTPSSPSRDRLRWIFPLTLLPLLIHVCTPSTEEPYRELVSRAKELPRVRRESIRTLDDVFRALEIDRVGAAWQSRFAMTQWLFALVAALAFWGLILLLFPLGRANSLHLWIVGLLMGTGGVLLLLGFQELARHPALLVGEAYAAAFDPAAGFFRSLAGYTLGVGLGEELVKLLPLVIVYRKAGTLDVRGAAAWGLAMGAGFGVSEAIHYAGELYNGLAPARIYAVRFVSVIALHMAWSAAAATRLSARRDDLADGERWTAVVVPMLLAAAPSIAMHGLYDALAKHGADLSAFFFALLGFAFFFWSSDRALARERAGALDSVSTGRVGE